MEKSALIVDTPDSCLRCNFCTRDLTYPTCKLHNLMGGSNNTSWEKLDTIPQWCPLIKIPEKLADCHGYNKGWNDVLDAIILNS